MGCQLTKSKHNKIHAGQKDYDKSESQEKEKGRIISFDELVPEDHREQISADSFSKEPRVLFVDGQYLGWSGRRVDFRSAAGLFFIPGLSDPNQISIQYIHDPDYYLSYTGDFKNKDIRFLKPSNEAHATWRVVKCGEKYALTTSCFSKNYFLTYDKENFFLKPEEDCTEHATTFILKIVHKYHNSIEHHERFSRPSPDELPEKPKHESFVSHRHDSIILPPFGSVIKTTMRTLSSQPESQPYLGNSCQWTSERNAADIVIDKLEYSTENITMINIHTVSRGGHFLSNAIGIENGCRFVLKGNISHPHTITWIYHQNLFENDTVSFEAVSEEFIPTGWFLVHTESRSKAILQEKPKLVNENWTKISSWVIECKN